MDSINIGNNGRCEINVVTVGTVCIDVQGEDCSWKGNEGVEGVVGDVVVWSNGERGVLRSIIMGFD